VSEWRTDGFVLSQVRRTELGHPALEGLVSDGSFAAQGFEFEEDGV
jgi:hypothetical protein